MYPAAAILGATNENVSTGQGIDEMEQLCAEVFPPGMAFEWTEINFMQIDAAKNVWNNLIFPLAVVFVFLVLAAQYESWALPLAVILVVPMCILGSLTGVAVTKTDINIFTQIGFVVLVGLASKNAILIVEFAKHQRESGLPRDQATLEACKLRLRPILMTSVAFILGVVPLLLSSGAGAEMRRTLGTAVFSGMLGVTLFGIFLTPVFFYVVEGFVEIPLFSSQRARELGKVLLYAASILTVGLLGLVVWLLTGKLWLSAVSILALMLLWLVVWLPAQAMRRAIPAGKAGSAGASPSRPAGTEPVTNGHGHPEAKPTEAALALSGATDTNGQAHEKHTDGEPASNGQAEAGSVAPPHFPTSGNPEHVKHP